MANIKIECPSCGSNSYQLLDSKTGEVVCQYCRNKWIVSELILKTETEKFLEEQSKRPVVIADNTTETDRQLMGMLSSLAGSLAGFLNPVRCLRSLFRRILVAVGTVVVVGLIIFALWFFLFSK